ncbi:MAG: DinB family protein [Gemmatimonadales bacterium]
MNEFLELFRYNAWATRILFDAVAPSRVPEEDYFRDLQSSFGGIHGTLQHIVWAEQLWLNRWLMWPNPAVYQGKDLTTLDAVRGRWEEVEAERNAFLGGMTDARLDDTRVVKPTAGGEFAHTFRQMFRHLINHSSYHRGQVVTFLRQLGHPAPNTDLIRFYRQR